MRQIIAMGGGGFSMEPRCILKMRSYPYQLAQDQQQKRMLLIEKRRK
ncbi:hypothetical protein [Priestia megaterium]|nr:hypothetical protein [Priestia megaterium]